MDINLSIFLNIKGVICLELFSSYNNGTLKNIYRTAKTKSVSLIILTQLVKSFDNINSDYLDNNELFANIQSHLINKNEAILEIHKK